METRTAILLATLIAVSQAAPQLQQQPGSSQQTDSASANDPTSASGTGSSTASNPNTSGLTPPQQSASGPSGSQSATVVFPPFNNLLPSFNFTGASGSSGGENPIAAIISVIPNAIHRVHDRFGNAVQQLVSQNVNAAADSISAAVQADGALMSDGVKAIASLPAFWANILG